MFFKQSGGAFEPSSNRGNRQAKKRSGGRRRLGAALRFESLEDRSLLTALPLSPLTDEPVALAAASVSSSTTTPTAATAFKVTFAAPSGASLTTGEPVIAYIQPINASGAVVSNYSGTVHFTSNDPLATLPADFTFTSSANSTTGEYARLTMIYNTAGLDTLVATDTVNPSITGSASIQVAAATQPVVAQFAISITPAAGSGMAYSDVAAIVNVTPETAAGALVSNYSGTIHFSSSDTAATLPANYTFTPSTTGATQSATFNVTFKTLGAQTLTVADTANEALADTAPVTVVTATAKQFKVAFATSSQSSPSALAGSTVYAYVTPETAQGSPVTNYTGTISFTSNDGAAVLPANYTFTGAASGSTSETARVPVTYYTPGLDTLVATDTSNSAITGSGSIQVATAVIAKFLVTITPTAGSTTTNGVTAGTPVSVTVTPETASGQTVTTYAGTIHFSSSDLAAVLPANYTFAPTTGGVAQSATFSATFKTAGSQTLTVSDASTSAITGKATVTVVAAAATQFKVTFASTSSTSPPSALVGTPVYAYVSPEDAFGNLVPNYTGTVAFSSNDSKAVLPANYAFPGSTANGGEYARVPVTYYTPGLDTLVATDTSNSAITGSGSIQVATAVIAKFVVTITPTPGGTATTSASVAAGSPVTVTVTPETASGQTVTTYAGTIHFSSSDLAAVLPANYTFAPTTGGAAQSATFSATFKTAGSQTLTVSDASTSAITGKATVTVVAAAATQFKVTFASTSSTSPPSALVGTPVYAYVSPEDAFGNLVPNYTGTVAFSSNDSKAILPANYSFPGSTANGGEYARLPVTYYTPGLDTLVATDTSNSAITGSGSIQVATAVIAKFLVTITPTAGSTTATGVTAGTPVSVTVTPETASGQTVTTYAGTIHFSSSDLAAVLPANYTFAPTTGGVAQSATFSATFKTAGSQTLTVSDASTSAITGKATVTVVAAAATQFKVTFASTSSTSPPSALVGTPVYAYVSPEDAFGNLVPNYTGTVAFSSNDSKAILPANYTFPGSTANGGEYARLPVTYYTPGLDTLVATDTSNSAITGSGSIQVATAVIAKFVVTITPTPGGTATTSASVTAGIPVTVTVTPETASGQTVTTYAGTIHFSSTDSQALLPANYTFAPSANGAAQSATFSVTLKTAGPQNIYVVDAANSADYGKASATVVAAAAASFKVTLVATNSTSSPQLGVPALFNILPVDAYGNAVNNYAGTVAFTSADPKAVLPANFTFTPSAGHEEVERFDVTFNTAGSETLTVTDVASPSMTGTWSGLTTAPFQNPANPMDVLGTGGAVTPLDLLAVITYLNSNSSGSLPTAPSSSIPYVDVLGKGSVSPLDLLAVITYLNERSSSGPPATVTTAAAKT